MNSTPITIDWPHNAELPNPISLDSALWPIVRREMWLYPIQYRIPLGNHRIDSMEKDMRILEWNERRGIYYSLKKWKHQRFLFYQQTMLWLNQPLFILWLPPSFIDCEWSCFLCSCVNEIQCKGYAREPVSELFLQTYQ